MTAKKRERVYIPVGDTVERMAKLGMSQVEIERSLGLKKLDITKKYLTEYQKGQTDIIERLRTAQLEVALDDRNVAMLMHLGKFYLGQTEKQEVVIEKVDRTLENVSTDDLIALVKDETSKDK